MMKALSFLLVQLSALHTLIKNIITNFIIPNINLSILSSLIKKATQPILSLTDPTSVSKTAKTLSTMGTKGPSTRLQTQPKAHTISKRRTTTRKSKRSIFLHVNEMPAIGPGVQCATM
jgi:hypothetical protein